MRFLISMVFDWCNYEVVVSDAAGVFAASSDTDAAVRAAAADTVASAADSSFFATVFFGRTLIFLPVIIFFGDEHIVHRWSWLGTFADPVFYFIGIERSHIFMTWIVVA